MNDASASNSPMSDREYLARVDAVLASVEAHVDTWLEDDVVDIDSQRNGGVLELTFPNASKIVLNSQPPLQEIWLAARSGGLHYKWKGADWRSTRDDQELFDDLSTCASEQAGQPLRFTAPE